MYDTKKIELVKKLVIVGLASLILLTGMGIGYALGNKGKTEAVKVAVSAKKKAPKSKEKFDLTSETVTKFLIAYYTKKDLGENQNRYQPLMTTAMFNEQKNNEAQPINQAYKGYVVDQVFSQASIYIDNDNLQVICVVDYKNTQRTKLNNDQNALKNQHNSETIKLTFQKAGKKYLVNKLERITLDVPYLASDRNSYEAIGTNQANSGDKTDE
jgi:hypothetical protein